MKQIFLLLFFLPTFAFAYTSPGMPSGYVNDFAHILSQQASADLEKNLRGFAQGGNPQIVVATIPSLQDEPIEEYANRLFREWGVGDKAKNNGVLFLIAPSDRKMRIEVGYGLEGALTDIETKHIQDDIVRPAFRNNDFDGGVKAAVDEIEKGLHEELETQKMAKKKGWSFSDIETIIFVAIFFLSWLGSILGRSKSWWAGGIIGGIGGVLAWALTQWLFWLPLAVIFGLLFDYVVSKNYHASRGDGPPSWWAGGGWGGWDRWGGGGGSFGSFGGGSSGGGGSSSNW